MFKPALTLALFAFLLLFLTARAQESVSGSILEVDDRSFPEVTAVVALQDVSGLAVSGLPATAFIAQETGAAATVTRVESVINLNLGLGVVLTIDVSGSMQGAAIIQARQAAGAFVQSLQTSDQAAVISFGSTVTVLSGMTADRNATLNAINGLTAAGNTALYNAVAESVNLARAATLPRRAIVLLSDGLDFGGVSRTTREEALSLAAEARIPIYTIGLGADIDRQFLQELARRSGGTFLEAPDPNRIAAVYNQISQLLRSQYVVTLRSTAPADVAQRTLSLTVTTPSGRATLQTEYQTRRTLAPAGSPPAPAQPPPASASEEGGGLLLPAFVGVLALAALLFLGRQAYIWRRDRRLAADIEQLSRRALGSLTLPAQPAPAQPQEPALSLVMEGPDGRRSFEVRSQPVTIGSAERCQVRLAGGRIDAEQARVWSMDGKLIFHQLSQQQPSRIGGQPVSWVVLNPGDVVEIGDYRLRLATTSEAGPARAGGQAASAPGGAADS